MTGQSTASHDASQPLRREAVSGRRDSRPGSQETCLRPANTIPRGKGGSDDHTYSLALCVVALLGARPRCAPPASATVTAQAAGADARPGPRPGHDLHRRRGRHRPDHARRRLLRRLPAARAPSSPTTSRTRSACSPRAGRTTTPVAPLSLTDQFGFGLGDLRDRRRRGEAPASVLVLQGQPRGGLGRRRPARDHERRRGPLLPRSGRRSRTRTRPSSSSSRPARATGRRRRSTVSVVEHKCVTDQNTFETTCTQRPGRGRDRHRRRRDGDHRRGRHGRASPSATVGRGDARRRRAAPTSRRRRSTPASTQTSTSCPTRARRAASSAAREGDKIKGTAGDDTIRSRGGDDTVDLRKGGADTVNCGKGNDKVPIKRKLADDGDRDQGQLRAGQAAMTLWPQPRSAAAAICVAVAVAGLRPRPGRVERGRGDADRDPRLRRRAGARGDPVRTRRESETVIRFLDREAEITTRYGGGFVQSIDGIAGRVGDGRSSDWFFFVNGIESSTRRAPRSSVRGGDRIWWDYRDWTDAMRVPAVVGSWPEPFAAGVDAAEPSARRSRSSASARGAVRRGRASGSRTTASRLGERRRRRPAPRLLVGPWERVRARPGRRRSSTTARRPAGCSRASPPATAAGARRPRSSAADDGAPARRRRRARRRRCATASEPRDLGRHRHRPGRRRARPSSCSTPTHLADHYAVGRRRRARPRRAPGAARNEVAARLRAAARPLSAARARSRRASISARWRSSPSRTRTRSCSPAPAPRSAVAGLLAGARRRCGVAGALGQRRSGCLIVAVNAIASQRGDTILVRGWRPAGARPDRHQRRGARRGRRAGAADRASSSRAFAVHSACVDPDRVLRLLRPLAPPLGADRDADHPPGAARRRRPRAAARGPGAARPGRRARRPRGADPAPASRARSTAPSTSPRRSSCAATRAGSRGGPGAPQLAPRLALRRRRGRRSPRSGSAPGSPASATSRPIPTIAHRHRPGDARARRRAAAARGGAVRRASTAAGRPRWLSRWSRMGGVLLRYPDAAEPALRELDLELAEGEFVVLAGRSGCGQVDACCAPAAGSCPHYHGGEVAGSLEVCGLDVREHGPAELGGLVGLVGQDPETQVVSATVRGELELPLELRGEPDRGASPGDRGGDAGAGDRRTSSTARPTRCRAASCSGSRSPRRSCCARGWSCSTSRPRSSTRSPATS